MKKSEKYKKEQEEIVNKIIDILEITDGYIIKYELDNDEEKHKKIIELVPDIKKYFTYNNIGGLKQPEKLKKPWISIIRQVLKMKYNFVSTDFTIHTPKGKLRTKKYCIYDKI